MEGTKILYRRKGLTPEKHGQRGKLKKNSDTPISRNKHSDTLKVKRRHFEPLDAITTFLKARVTSQQIVK